MPVDMTSAELSGHQLRNIAGMRQPCQSCRTIAVQHLLLPIGTVSPPKNAHRTKTGE